MKFTKEEARKLVLNCAKKYHQNLLNKMLLVIYRDRHDNKIRYIEVVFHKRNYQHLTGLELIDKKGKVLRNQSINFYRKCIENKLSLNEIRFRPDGTTQLKLAALPILMDVTKITKITGDYNNFRPFLYVDKVMGGVNFCLGLTLENNYRVYNSNMNLTSDFTTNTQDYLLDVTQGLWTNIYDKANVESIDINFNGDNKKLTVYLTHDGLQTFSMLEKGLYSPSLTLKNTPLNNDDIKKVKDLIFYDDTIKFELEEGLVGEVAVEIVRVRKGITTTRNISISIKSYAYAYYFGITSLFGELPQEGDKYTLICNSIPASYGKTIKIDTPYSAQATVTAVKGQAVTMS